MPQNPSNSTPSAVDKANTQLEISNYHTIAQNNRGNKFLRDSAILCES